MNANEGPLSEQERTVLQALRALQFGSVEVVIHEGRIVEVNQKRKVRFQDPSAKPPPPRHG